MQVGADGQTAIEQLVKEAQKGDPAALAALYERFFDQIYRYVSFKSGSRAEAEDITGDGRAIPSHPGCFESRAT